MPAQVTPTYCRAFINIMKQKRSHLVIIIVVCFHGVIKNFKLSTSGISSGHGVEDTIRPQVNNHSFSIGVNKQDDRRACNVRIENKFDFHHEVLESMVLRFPLPWHKFNCSTSKPINYYFALYQNRFHLNIRFAKMGSGAENARYLNETEFWTWKKYFESDLQNKTFNRLDGSNTLAHFNKLVTYEEPIKYDANIDAGCGNNEFRKNHKTFCILHASKKDVIKANPSLANRSCFLTPMYPPSQCKFMAIDLPKFQEEEVSTPSSEVSICVHGNRNRTRVIELLLMIPFEEYNIKFVITQRNDISSYKKLLKESGFGDRTTIVNELDYVKFHKNFARCDIVIPFIEPFGSKGQEYFDFEMGGNKKSSGITPAIISYKRPSVVHEAYAVIYRDYFTAPIEVYGNTLESKADAVKRMIIKVHKEKKTMLKTDTHI